MFQNLIILIYANKLLILHIAYCKASKFKNISLVLYCDFYVISFIVSLKVD